MGQFKMTEETILQAVMDEKLFGALEVDLHVPDDLKSKFAEMPAVFINIDVSRDDISDHMKAYAEEKGKVTRRDFQYCAMDTDSAYMALSAGSVEEVIKPEMQQHYQMEKKNWFPRTDTPQLAAYDKRTPGLIKTEFAGDGMIALCSKTYFCFGVEDKFSCKGVNRKTNDVTKEKYMDVLLTKQSGSGTNRGFRTIDNQVYTYLQERAGFSYFYPKWKVLADGVSTAPLEIWGERHTMYIVYVYSWRKKKYQKDWYKKNTRGSQEPV